MYMHYTYISLVQVRTSCSGHSSKENTPEASKNTPEATRNTPEATRNTPEAAKLVDGPRFILKLPASNKRKKKKVSPRTSPRILTEDAVNLTPTNQDKIEDVHPAINSVASLKSLGGTAPTVLSQLRKGSVEQAIKSFEKLQTSD